MLLPGELVLGEQDLAQARRGFVPASSWGVAQAAVAGGPSSWQDVGGLDAVVLALREALELPLRHPRLIAR